MLAVNLNSNRRSFLKAGAAGLAVFAVGGLLAARLTDGTAQPLIAGTQHLDADGQQIMYKICDAVLGEILPPEGAHEVLLKSLDLLDGSLGQLPVAVQKDVSRLLSVLSFAPARLALAGRWQGWAEASREDVTNLLDGLRTSNFEFRRLVYVTLHDLAALSFYGLEESWQQVGYGGPLLSGPGEEV